jgi:hypothetical protein
MAKVLDTFPDRMTRCRLQGWGRFLDGKVWSIQRGVDFKVEIAEARSGMLMARKRLGMTGRVKTMTVDSTPGKEVLVVQYVA